MGALCTKEPGCGKGALATPRGSGLHTDSEPKTLQTGHSAGQEGERGKRATQAQHAVTEGDWTWVGGARRRARMVLDRASSRNLRNATNPCHANKFNF